MEMTGDYDCSVVVLIFNERENIASLHAEILHATQSLSSRVEIIYVDDGSTDGSDQDLRELKGSPGAVVVIRHEPNRGQTSALRTGIQAARGRIIVPIDGDRQNDPADIPRLMNRLDTAGSGCQAVCGWRKDRQDRFLGKRLPSSIGNAVARSLSRSPVHDTGCTLKAMRAHAARAIPLYSDMHRFIPALLALQFGADAVQELPVRHRPRAAGKSKYGWGRAGKVIRDLETIAFLWLIHDHAAKFWLPGTVSLLGAVLFGWIDAPMAAGVSLASTMAAWGTSLVIHARGSRLLPSMNPSDWASPGPRGPFFSPWAWWLTSASLAGVASACLVAAAGAAWLDVLPRPASWLALSLALVGPASLARRLAQWGWVRQFTAQLRRDVPTTRSASPAPTAPFAAKS